MMLLPFLTRDCIRIASGFLYNKCIHFYWIRTALFLRLNATSYIDFIQRRVENRLWRAREDSNP